MEKTEIRHLLHKLWTRDVGTAGYDKKDWLELEGHIEELIHFKEEAWDAAVEQDLRS